MHIARQRAIPKKHAAGLSSTYEKALRILLERAETQSYALATLISDAVVRAGVLAMLDPGAPEVPSLVELAGQAGAALFALGRSGGAPIDVPLGGKTTTVSGRPEDSQLYVGRWLDAYFTAMFARDRESMRSLRDTTTDQLRRSPTRGDEFQYQLVDVLRALAAKDDDAARESLARALGHADADSVRVTPMDRVEEVEAPVLAALGRLLGDDGVGFESAVQNLIELHARFWSQGERREDLAGLVCVRAGALLVLAKKRGIETELSSDYVPSALLAAR